MLADPLPPVRATRSQMDSRLRGNDGKWCPLCPSSFPRALRLSPVPSVFPACPPSFRRALRHSRGSGNPPFPGALRHSRGSGNPPFPGALRHSRGSGNPRAVFQPSRAPGFMSERSVKSSCWIASCALNIRVPKRTVLAPPLRSCRVTTMPKGQRRVALHQAHHTTHTVAEALAEDKRHIRWQVALPGWGMRSIPTGRSHSSVRTARASPALGRPSARRCSAALPPCPRVRREDARGWSGQPGAHSFVLGSG